MTEAKPPEFYFNGIVFNTQYFKDESDTIGFTQDESDARYLRKKIPDTASALQTFSAGLVTGGTLTANIITTNGIGVGNPSASFSLLTAQTGTLSFGSSTGRTGNINIANTQTTGTGNIVLGSLALTTGSQKIQINRPLTIGYTTNPSLISQIGGTVFFTTTGEYTFTTTDSSTIAVLNDIPIGIYQVYYYVKTVVAVSSAVITERTTAVSTNVDNTTTGIINFMIQSEYLHQTRTVGHNVIINGSGIFQNNTANDSIYLNQTYTITGSANLRCSGHLQIVRIG
jgi:hypothetical protein